MIVYPAIDLKGGKCVRLTRGEMDSAKVYNESPELQAKEFEAAGFSWIHVVDLDGAFDGKSSNSKSISKIIESVKIPVQLGGGIRTFDDVSRWIDIGVSRIIIGTAAVRSPEMLRRACSAFPDKIAVGIDTRNGFAALQGWADQSSVRTGELAIRAQDAGACAIIHTDIERDGTGGGLNVDATSALASVVIDTPVIASGGVGGVKDIISAKEAKNIAGAIVGKALYNGSISYKQAIDASL